MPCDPLERGSANSARAPSGSVYLSSLATSRTRCFTAAVPEIIRPSKVEICPASLSWKMFAKPIYSVFNLEILVPRGKHQGSAGHQGSR